MGKSKKVKREQLGFKQALEYVLDVLSYAYYCKADNLVSDFTFDELEKLYCKLFDVQTAPHRGIEKANEYSYGVQFIYDEIKRRRKN